MKHIVKFNQASDANNYEIKNVPFLTTIGENNQLLTCNEENKKIIIDSQGNANVVDGINLIEFYVNHFGSVETYQAESDMTWKDWIESGSYGGPYYQEGDDGYVSIIGDSTELIYVNNNYQTPVNYIDEIIHEHTYYDFS